MCAAGRQVRAAVLAAAILACVGVASLNPEQWGRDLVHNGDMEVVQNNLLPQLAWQAAAWQPYRNGHGLRDAAGMPSASGAPSRCMLLEAEDESVYRGAFQSVQFDEAQRVTSAVLEAHATLFAAEAAGADVLFDVVADVYLGGGPQQATWFGLKANFAPALRLPGDQWRIDEWVVGSQVRTVHRHLRADARLTSSVLCTRARRHTRHRKATTFAT